MDTLTRRRFLMSSGVVAGTALAAGATGVTLQHVLTRARTDGRSPGQGILVLVTLYGGNDGLSTLVPYADAAYHDARPGLAFTADQTLHLDDAVGLNAALPGLKKRWDDGRLAIVRGVGYPKPDHSHFRSMAIWQTAAPEHAATTGWLGRWLDSQPHDPLRAVCIGAVAPPALAGARTSGAVLPLGPLRLPDPATTQAMRLSAKPYGGESLLQAAVAASGSDLLTVADQLGATLADLAASDQNMGATLEGAAAAPNAKKGAGPLDAQLAVVAQCIKAGAPTQVYAVSLGGFDTHANEKDLQSRMLGELDQALAGFVAALEGNAHGGDVTMLVHSEFGRRVAANGSDGTDHGTAGPVFLLGEGVIGGFYGDEPSLTDLDDGDLKFTTDFRSVYASVLNDVLGSDPAQTLGASFDQLPLLA